MRRKRLWLVASATAGLAAALVVSSVTGASRSGSTQLVANAGDTPSNALLNVFVRPRTQRDAMPQALADSVADLAGDSDLPQALRNGTIQTGTSRLLLSRAGTTQGDFYAILSAKGYVCHALTTGPQSCQQRFTANHPVGTSIFDRDGPGQGIPTAIIGLVPNNVISLDVLVDGRVYPARLENNAYFFEFPTSQSWATDVVVRFSSGKSTTVPLPPRPQLGP